MKFEYLISSFHSESISSIDIAVRKPLIVSTSRDKQVKIWNYLDNTLDISIEFEEECHSVAIHPTGLYLIVGFTDKIKMFNIMEKTLEPFKDIPIKMSEVIKFSNGGHLFAVSNSNIIQVFNF